MLKRTLKSLWAFLLIAWQNPASAHVKWFLSKSESELLRLPKPALFTQLRAENVLAVGMLMLALTVAYRLNKRFASWPINERLQSLALRFDSYIQLAIGVFCGSMLIYNAFNMCFFVPNLHLHPCCKWVAVTEAAIGGLLLVGLFTRFAASAMLCILLFSLLKFPFGDCVDLLPMYGIALYVLVAGRGKWSVDGARGFLQLDETTACALATILLRVALGSGLVALGFDEKLFNPQLAVNLLQNHPQLNILHAVGVGNDLYVLVSGLVEVGLGAAIVLCIFPRLCVIVLAALFAVTTFVFGGAELIGHLPYFAIFAAIFLRSANGSVLCRLAKFASAYERSQRNLFGLLCSSSVGNMSASAPRLLGTGCRNWVKPIKPSLRKENAKLPSHLFRCAMFGTQVAVMALSRPRGPNSRSSSAQVPNGSRAR